MNSLNGCSFLLILLCLCPILHANDPDSLQDICVADTNSTVKVNGFVCLDAAAVTPDHFSSAIIAKPGNTSNPLGAVVTLANAANFPGLNTFGISYARIDFAKGGLNPPHIHPRASELLYVQKGRLHVGFVTTTNKLFAKTVSKGEIFIFPKGLIHFQLAAVPSVGIAALTSQNPGTSQVARATFASIPSIDDAVLKKAFQISDEQVKHMKDLISKT